MVRADGYHFRMVEEVTLESLEDHHQRQGLLFNRGVGNLMRFQPGGIVRGRMKDASIRVLLEENGPDTHSTGVHEEMEWLAVVWRSKDKERGEEGFRCSKARPHSSVHTKLLLVLVREVKGAATVEKLEQNLR